jgi:3-hydroxyisobutyrate dehydrogenase-like beta-hydroxyacid dehydrogenase
LPGPAQVEEVLLDPKDGILAGLSSGGAFIDTTTNSPVMIKRLAEACRARSVEILDAPVTGRPPGMVMMVGGERRVFNKYQPVLQCMAEGVFYMGDLGQGMIAKAANQLIGFTSFFGIVEALLIGAKAGMDIGAFVEMYSARRGANPQLERLAPVFKGVFDGYPINVALKDASVACELAESAGMDAPMAFLTRRILERGQTEGLGEEPFGHVVRMLEELAGVELRISSATT